MKIVRLKQVDSTNRKAFELLDIADEVLVFSEKQTAGYGRNGSQWVSPEGNIYFSYGRVCEVSELSKLSVKTAVFLAEWLADRVKGNLAIKWPNDIYLDGKKIAGILVETKIKSGVAKAVVGVGINYSKAPVENSGFIENLSSLTKEDFEKNIAENISTLFVSEFWKDLKKRFERYSFLKPGDKVEFSHGKERLKGEFLGFSEDIAIKIKISEEILIFHSGEVKKIRKS